MPLSSSLRPRTSVSHEYPRVATPSYDLRRPSRFNPRAHLSQINRRLSLILGIFSHNSRGSAEAHRKFIEKFSLLFFLI